MGSTCRGSAVGARRTSVSGSEAKASVFAVTYSSRTINRHTTVRHVNAPSSNSFQGGQKRLASIGFLGGKASMSSNGVRAANVNIHMRSIPCKGLTGVVSANASIFGVHSRASRVMGCSKSTRQYGRQNESEL